MLNDSLQTSPAKNNRQHYTTLIAGVFILAVFVILAYWGGLPPTDKIPLFALGIAVLIIVCGGISVLGWVLLFRPVAFPVAHRSVLTGLQRQVIGVALIVTTGLEMVGGTWDEAWHTRYGIPFGKDFFWRPHLLIYSSLLCVIVAASVSYIALVRRGKGNWVQRFRADPALGMVIFTGLFLAFSIPADPIWHSIYGEDISAFSIPHVLLTMMFVFALVAGSALVTPPNVVRKWQSVLRLRIQDTLPLFVLALLLQTPVTLLTAEWYSLQPANLVSRTAIAFQLPDWLPIVFVIFLATWIAVAANRQLRYFGVGTVLGVLSVLFRFAVTIPVNSPFTPQSSFWLLLIPPMIIVDVVYFIRVKRDQACPWWLVGPLASIGLVVMLPLANRLLLYPQVALGNLLGMIVFPTLAATMGAWIGTLTGDYLAAQNVTPKPVTTEAAPYRRWIVPGMAVAAVLFVLWFIATATPPVLSS